MRTFAFLTLSIVFATAVLRYGGVLAIEWYGCLVALSLAAALYWITVPKGAMAPRPRWQLIALSAGVLAVPLMQIIPWPLSLVQWISPQRALVHEALAPVVDAGQAATLSIGPAVTVRHLITLAGYVVVLFLVRELAWRYRDKVWLLAVPLVAVGVTEAVLGLVQSWVFQLPMARGTYINRNHFAGLLEMVIPFAVMGAAAMAGQRGRWRSVSMRGGILAGAALAGASVMLLGVVFSSSRMGFTATLAGLGALGFLLLGTKLSGRARTAGFLIILLIAAIGFFSLPTEALVDRFATITGSEQITADMRVEIWRNTIDLIRDFPLAGCGLGCYELGIFAYRTAAPLNALDFAHNDYLQILSETGIAGFALFGTFALYLVLGTLRSVNQPADHSTRYLAIACLGALAAIALHSLTDFNLYVPANALVVAWVAGIGEGLRTA